jgi:hypothetical protein
MANWWVNQGQSYEAERQGGYIWAPVDSHGRRLSHWDTMTQVSVGDRVIHYARGVQAISTVTASALATLKPKELPDAWASDGRLVRCLYRDIRQPIGLDEIPESWRRALVGGPFRRDGKVNQGYLYPLTDGAPAPAVTFGTTTGDDGPGQSQVRAGSRRSHVQRGARCIAGLPPTSSSSLPSPP